MYRRIIVRSSGVEPRAGGPVLPLPVRRLRAVASRPVRDNPDLYYRTNLLLAPVTPAPTCAGPPSWGNADPGTVVSWRGAVLGFLGRLQISMFGSAPCCRPTRRRSRPLSPRMTNGSPRGVPAHGHTRTSWPNCSAVASEDPVVPGRGPHAFHRRGGHAVPGQVSPATLGRPVLRRARTGSGPARWAS